MSAQNRRDPHPRVKEMERMTAHHRGQSLDIGWARDDVRPHIDDYLIMAEHKTHSTRAEPLAIGRSSAAAPTKGEDAALVRPGHRLAFQVQYAIQTSSFRAATARTSHRHHEG
jgi:hypothetical protein